MRLLSSEEGRRYACLLSQTLPQGLHEGRFHAFSPRAVTKEKGSEQKVERGGKEMETTQSFYMTLINCEN